MVGLPVVLLQKSYDHPVMNEFSLGTALVSEPRFEQSQ